MAEINPILLIENDPATERPILTSLAQYRLANEVVVTSDGAEALDFLYRRGKFRLRRNAIPAVILLDLKIQAVDGLSLLKIIKSDPYFMPVPLIILKDSPQESDEFECRQWGVQTYLEKPLQFDRFLKMIPEVGLRCAVLDQWPIAA